MIYFDAVRPNQGNDSGYLSYVDQGLTRFRESLSVLTYPIYVLAEFPYQAKGTIDAVFQDRNDLFEHARISRERLIRQTAALQRLAALEAENDRLRQLLGSKSRLPATTVIAEIIGEPPDPGTLQVVIGKGRDDGLAVGDAVIDSSGLFGQIIEVGAMSSRILLVTDRDHATPVQVNRTGTRLVLGGTGDSASLVLENVPISTDIQIGDLLETSGLGGRFPPGYPVATVSEVAAEKAMRYVAVTAVPTAKLNRSGHVLVLIDAAEQSAQP